MHDTQLALCFNSFMKPPWFDAFLRELEIARAEETAPPPVELTENEKQVAHYRRLFEHTLEMAEQQEETIEYAVEELAKAKEESARKDALIEQLKITIAKQQRELFGTSSEHASRLQDQPELQLDEPQPIPTEVSATEQPIIIQAANAIAIERKKPARKHFGDDLPRERVVIPSPTYCECCGGSHLTKLGEDITETLEVIPRTWKVVQTVREKFSCRNCEKISQSPAPFHVTPRGWAGPNLLAMILFEKFGQHQPLNRQRDRYAREGVDLSLSTLSDQVGVCCSVLHPLFELIEDHTFQAERLHGDDTTVPVLAKGKTSIGRSWIYVRDDKPFNGPAPPAAVFYYSPDRKGEHPQAHLATYNGILQADAYGGYGQLYEDGSIVEAGCWAHARRKFFVLADVRVPQEYAYIQPMAAEAVRRIDALMATERAINGLTADERFAVRQEFSVPLVAELETWMRGERAKLSKHSPVAKAIDYLLKRWPSFVRFLEDGRICMTNNAAERGVRGIALGRKSWLFVGSDCGGDRAAIMYSLIVTAKLNGVDPQAWLADVLGRIAGHPAKRLGELLPWNWQAARQAQVS